MTISARQALENMESVASKWPTARRRLRLGTVFPLMKPTFRLSRGDTVFTMGSCFARNIEVYLKRWNFNVPMREFSLPREEYGADEAVDTLTLYNPPTFRQEIEWAERVYARDGIVSEEDCNDFLFDVDGGQYLDLGLNRVYPSPKPRCIERRQSIFDIYKFAFEADCVIMTPGVSEVFRNKRTGFCSNPTPLHNGALLTPDDWEFSFVDHDATVDDLVAVIDLVRKHNPASKFLITVSPVPLFATFSGLDILVANARSKAILRSACATVIEKRPQADYFPSYEAVTLSSRRVWKRDRRHVSDGFVRKIVENLASFYVPELALPRPDADSIELNLGQRLVKAFTPGSAG